ncbi:MAG: ATP-dependent DNA helicase RecQ [Kiritimatiellia bacterium]|jgi:ATP-dependent DNA helicase RecQ
MTDLILALKENFGFEAFLEGQEEAIAEVVDQGRDVLLIMPTGSGKSLCYQLPALLLDGVTLVISPLIALMKDQVDALVGRGIAATFINSSLSQEDMYQRLREIQANVYKLVYIAPERFRNERFLELMHGSRIAMIAVDEAHCISQWGHDFRPDYLRLRHVIRDFPASRIMAMTATATPDVREDIERNLGLGDHGRAKASIFVFGFARPNLKIKVTRAGTHTIKLDQVLSAAERYHTGIVYCSTRKQVEKVYKLMKAEKLSVGMYHGGLTDAQREKMQNRFISKAVPLVVATNAFGMGIDRDDVRFIIHWDIPGSMEAYYQEIGRAGRDGEDSYCELLYNYADVRTQEFFLEGANPMRETITETLKVIKKHCSHGPATLSITDWSSEIHSTNNDMAVQAAMYILERAGLIVRSHEQGNRTATIDLVSEPDMAGLNEQLKNLGHKRERDRARLNRTLDYVDTRKCRHSYILEYFGEPAMEAACDVCDNCVRLNDHTLREPTEDEWPIIQKILSCIGRHNNRFGRARICQILVGSKAKQVRDLGLDKSQSYNQLAGHKEAFIRQVLDELVRENCVEVSTGDYPVLGLTAFGKEVMWRKHTIHMEWPESSRSAQRSGSTVDDAGVTPVNPVVFDALKQWRNQLARTRHIPPYLILTDKSLRAIAATPPSDQAELTRIWGIGPNKAKQFGNAILQVLQTHQH